MKKLYAILLLLTTVNLSLSAQYTLIEPKSNNGIVSKNSTTVYSTLSIAPPLSGEGTRLMWIPAMSAFRVGTVYGAQWDQGNIGTWSFASGSNTTAHGIVSTAMGNGTTASGTASTAMGRSTTASGDNSTAMGISTTARNDNSTAMGNTTLASGGNSTAMGYNTTAQAYNSLAIGQYNVISGNQFDWVATDPLFVIGNGSDLTTPSNALTVLKNGKVGINNAAPYTMLDVTGDIYTSFHNSTNLHDATEQGTRYIGHQSGNDIGNDGFAGMKVTVEPSPVLASENGAKISFRTWGSTIAYSRDVMTINEFGNVGIGTSTPCEKLEVAGNIRASGSVLGSQVLCISDIRYKKNIKNLSHVMTNLSKIQGVSYDWRREAFPEKGFNAKSQIGFIAQEVEKIFPDMVETDAQGYKSVNYIQFTPLMLEAIKELKTMVEKLQTENTSLKADNKTVENRLARIEALLMKQEEIKTATK